MKLSYVTQKEKYRITWRQIAYIAILPTIVILYIVTGYSATAPPIAKLPGDDRIGQPIRQIFPQGWGFFTRPADSEMLVPYAITDQGSLEPITMGVNSEPRFIFGFDRTSRSQAVEITLLLDGLTEDSWLDCAHSPERCLRDWENSMSDFIVENYYAKPSICGRVAIVAESVTPFLWREMEETVRLPSEMIVLNVECKDKTSW